MTLPNAQQPQRCSVKDRNKELVICGLVASRQTRCRDCQSRAVCQGQWLAATSTSRASQSAKHDALFGANDINAVAYSRIHHPSPSLDSNASRVANATPLRGLPIVEPQSP